MINRSVELEKADIIAVIAKSGMGKTHLIKKLIRNDKRLLIYDYKDEYNDIAKRVTTFKELLEELRKPNFRVCFPPRMASLDADFRYLCKAAYNIGSMRYVADELDTATKPSYAPPEWRDDTSRGRARGLHIIGSTQFPAKIDKDFLANVTEGFAGGIKLHIHAKTMELSTGISADLLKKLQPRQFVRWSD